jgi:hypothetical protein
VLRSECDAAVMSLRSSASDGRELAIILASRPSQVDMYRRRT